MIDFFKSHRLVRGSISILLALLLLPLYTFIAVVMESARYRSAQEQLGELTYLGEMAILADYVDFLANDYSIYAYNNNDLKDSFSKYMNKVTTSGGVDTRKLNKLFGVDIEKCELQYMYSVADPEVLAYQIRQNGRYALPLKAFNELVLTDLFRKLEKGLKNVNKKLALIKNSTSVVSDATEIISGYKNMSDALDTLKGKLSEFEHVRSTLADKQDNTSEIWNKIKEDLENPESKIYSLFEEIYIMNQDDQENQGDPIINQIQSKIDSQEQLLNAFNGMWDTMKTYFESDNKQTFTVKIEKEWDFLNITVDQDGNALCSEVLTELASCAKVNAITNIDEYDRIISDINNNIKDDDDLLALYNSSQPIFDFVDEYKNSGYYEKLGGICKIYGDYIEAVKQMSDKFKEMVDSYNSAVAALDAWNFEQDLNDLNESGEQARKDRAEYDASLDDLDAEAQAELKRIMDESASKRNEAYQTARKNRDFANIGTNVVAKFLSEVNDKLLDKWETNLNAKYIGNINGSPLPNFTDNDYDSFVEAVEKLYEYNFNDTYIEEYDFYKAHGSTSFNVDEVFVNNNNNGGIKDRIINFIEDLKNDLNLTENEEYISKENLEKIYNVFINAEDGSVLAECSDDEDKKWFSFNDSNGSYYFSKQTTIMLFAYMVGSTLITEASDESVNKTLSAIKTVLKTLGNLMPDDPSLNNHIGNKSNTKTLSTEYCTFPSEGSYYNKISMDSETDPKKIEERVRQISHEYVDRVIKDKNNFPINNYYINKSDKTSLYEFIFTGRQPGSSIQQLVTGYSKLIESIIDFLDGINKINIIKALRSLRQFFDSLVRIVDGIIKYYGDVCQIIGAVIDDLSKGETKVLQYILDQLYIGFYAANTFTSRQNAKGCDGDYNELFTKNYCGKNCYDVKNIFDGAEMEYLLEGSPCEVTNQHTAFYAVLTLRFLLNFTMVAGDDFVRELTNVPYVGAVLLFIAVYAEANLDMMFLIGGVKVPLIKFKMSLNPENLDNFIDSMETAINNTQQQKMKWTMQKTTDGDLYRQYENNNQTMDDMISENLQISMGVGEGVGKGKNAKGVFPIDYNWYINILLLLYPEDVKLGRISDLIQMHGMEKKGPYFRLEECYTYVYADVYADYSPLLPMLSGNRDSDPFPDIRSVQVNGY